MTTLEIVLIIVSVVETILTVWLRRRDKLKAEAIENELRLKVETYEKLISALPIGRSCL